jgi:hypothetical protein
MCKISPVWVMAAAYVGWQSLMVDYRICGEGKIQTHSYRLSDCKGNDRNEHVENIAVHCPAHWL